MELDGPVINTLALAGTEGGVILRLVDTSHDRAI